ncbi:hypothetical protein FJZ53_02705 [Candidatus Woesearchaeota archaeon]|nr:hypothetical protein [Candidatus Woesearchaeota archaeon]
MKAKTIIVILALLAIVGAFYYTGHKTIDPIIPEKGEDLALKTFASEDDLKTFLKSAQSQGRGYMMYDAMGGPEMMVAKASAESAPTSAGAGSYSTTNIQVEGVDEADIIKNDNKYIYAVSGKKVVIVDAYPAEQAEILSTIKLDDTPSDIFINKDKLVVMGNKQTSYDARKYIDEVPAAPTAKMIRAPDYYPRYQQRTFINVYDISDRKKPELVDEVEVKGYYYNSRMVGDYVYVIANDQAYYYEGRPVPMPLIVRGGTEKTLLPTDIMYCPIPSTSYSYTNILSVNTQNKNEDVGHKVILTGASQNMYMSLGNIYLTTMKGRTWIEYRKALLDEVMLPALPSSVVEKVKAVQEDDDYARWGQIDEITQTYFESLPNEESVKFTKEIEPKTQDFERRWRKQSEKTVIHRIAVKTAR